MSNTHPPTGGKLADMTVRQHYAATAMRALIGIKCTGDVGKAAVEIADRMLAAEGASEPEPEPSETWEPTPEQDLALMEDMIVITDRLRLSADKSAYELMDEIRDGKHGDMGNWESQAYNAIDRLRKRLTP